MVKCPICQKENPDGACFCFDCGAPIGKNGMQKKSKNSPVFLIITIILVTVSLAAAGITYYLREDLKRQVAQTETESKPEVISQTELEEDPAVVEYERQKETYAPLVATAKEAVFAEWEKILGKNPNANDGHVEIANTRLIKIADNDNAYFKDVDCVIEFVVRTDYNGTAPYYANAGTFDDVVFYRDGTCKAVTGFFGTFVAKNKDADLGGVIEKTIDFGTDFNESNGLPVSKPEPVLPEESDLSEPTESVNEPS